MSKKNVDAGTSSDRVNSSNNTSSNTRMFIIPPDVIQNICITDSMTKDRSRISAMEVEKEDNVSIIRSQEDNDEQVSTSIESSKNAIKVPETSSKDEKVIPRINRAKRIKNNPHINTQKAKDNIKIDKSTIKVENNQTTPNDTPKPQRTDSVSQENSSENLLGRSKRIRKRTKFDHYIVTYKEDIDKKRERTIDKESQELTVSSSSLSRTTMVNDPNHAKCTKEELQVVQNKKRAPRTNSNISIAPVVTDKSLPLNSSNNSGDKSTVITNKNFSIKRLQNSKDVANKVKLKESKNTAESNSMNDNEAHMGTMNTSVIEHNIIERDDTLAKNLKRKTKDLRDKNTSDSILNVENEICTNANKVSNTRNQGDLNMNSLNESSTDQTSMTTPLVKKRGRPKKAVPTLQQTPNISDASADNLETLENINNVSIAEAVVHSKRRNNRSYNICSNDGLSDDSSTEDNIPNSIVDRKRSRPADTSASRGKDRGKGRGKGRGRGRGKALSNSSLDIDYIPKSKGPVTTDRQENSDAVTISNTPKVDLITCAKCEIEISRNQWNLHNLRKHNNMSWVKGDEPPDFENDIKLWRRVLTAAHHKKKGQLACEKCGSVKRSVNGFISHVQFCGKSDEERQALMATCSVCGAVMMPSSMEIHERSHRQAEQSKVKELQNSSDNERVKRKAAEKAVSKILEFTELVKDNNIPPGKKLKLESSLLKNVIKAPKQSKNIPSVWKGIWKKELVFQGTATCRQINCTYKCASFEEICKHSTKCTFAPKECYMCKICKYSTATNEDMTKHVKTEHPLLEGNERYSDYEEEHYSSDENNKETSFKINFLNAEQRHKIHWKEPYHPALRWSMEFERKNYELDLFNDYIPNDFTLLNNIDAAKYLPELEVSIRTKVESTSDKSCGTEIPWKQWTKFEGGFDNDVATFFVGGPVWALAWLPIPAPMYSKDPSQYVAISTHPTMESEYTIGKSYSGCNMIQIWNVGPLDNESNKEKKSPTLSYAITHNSGTVWCLEWCPSGCYQDESVNNYKEENKKQSSLKRIGMLAAACSDGNVYIYSLPFPEELEFKKTTENEWPIYYTDPIMTLVVNISMYDNNDQNWQCTKLSWTKEHGHNTIAAGFSNGYVALWDLTYKSPLSMQKRRNTWFINAFQYFYAHGNAVSMIALVPYNGERFLASGSLDKSYKFWDLEDTSAPQYCVQKGIILDGAWMTHWPCAVVSFDDAFGYKHTNSYVIPLRELEYKFFPILATNSPTYTLAVSDYANSIAHGTLAGEVLTIFPHQMIQGKELDKALQKKRKLSSFVKVVDFSKIENGNNSNNQDSKNSKDYCYMPDTYNECKDRFGVIFCDDLKNVENCSRKPGLHPEKLTAVPVEEYPFMSVNRISWNPNSWSYLWLAIGYQNGLVRLLTFKYMPVSRELKTLLPQHIRFMLNKSQSTLNECCIK